MLIDHEDLLSQKKACINFLDKFIDGIYEKAEDEEGLSTLQQETVELGLTSLEMLRNVLRSQEIKEPMDDVMIYAGYPEIDSPCYHILVRPEDRRRMEKDPNIHFCLIKKFTGVMEQDNKPKRKLVYKDNKAYCAECGRRIYVVCRPHHCRSCGTLIDWSEEWWYRDDLDNDE